MPRCAFPIFALLLLVQSARSAPVSFVKDLVPILNDQCLNCHEEKKAKGAYRVDTYEWLLKPGDTGDVLVVAGQPEESHFLGRLTTPEEDDRMPQKGDPLSAPQIDLFKRWISEGAKFDGPNPKALLTELQERKEAPAAPEKYPRPVPITALAWLKDGKILAASGYREVILWDADAGTILKRIPGMPERVLAVSLHPDGKTLAIAGGVPGRAGELVLVNLEDGKVVKRLPNAKDTYLTVAFSPDGRYLAAGGTANVLRVFSGAEWKEAWTAEAHADWITSVSFSPDSKHLVSSSRDRTARICNAEKGTVEVTQSGHGNSLSAAVFDHGGKTILSASIGELRRWVSNADSNGDGSPPSKVLQSPRQEVTRLGILPKGLVAANAEGKAYAYDFEKPGPPKELFNAGARLNALAISPDGLRVAIGGSNGQITVLGLADPAQKRTWMGSPGL